MGEEKRQEEAKNQEQVEDKPKSEVEKKEDEEKVKEIVMNVYMHCEGCARKIRKCLKDFQGVEEVITECKWQKVVVKGEKLDVVKVVERVQKKSHRQVELLSPILKHDTPPQETKAEVKEALQTKDIKLEPKVIRVILKVQMHCEACSLEIKKRIERMKEVEEAIPDLKNSQVSVKGTFDPTKLVNYVYKRTGKHATIVKQDPLEETKDDDKDKDGNKDEKNGQDDEKKSEEKGEESTIDKKEGEGGGDGGGTTNNEASMVAAAAEETLVELRRNVYNYNYYPPIYPMEMNTYPPQIFSDENPNACSIM